MDNDEFDQLAGAFMDFLSSKGLTVRKDFYDSEHFGNRLIEMENDFVVFVIMLDRSFGDVGVLGAGWHGKQYPFGTDNMREMLFGPPEKLLDFREQITFWEQNWSLAIDPFNPLRQKETLARLKAMIDEKVRKRNPGLISDQAGRKWF